MALKAERDENVCRLDFLPTEAVRMGEAIWEIEGPAARERQAVGHFNAPQYEQNPVRQNLPNWNNGRTRDKVGAAVGMSGKTYEKARAVVEAAWGTRNVNYFTNKFIICFPARLGYTIRITRC